MTRGRCGIELDRPCRCRHRLCLRLRASHGPGDRQPGDRVGDAGPGQRIARIDRDRAPKQVERERDARASSTEQRAALQVELIRLDVRRALFDQPIVRERVIAPDGSEAFVLVEARRLKDFVKRWRVAGPYDPEDQLAPPEVEPGRAGPAPGGLRWRLYRWPLASVSLNDFFAMGMDQSCAWAVNFAHSDAERAVRIWAGFDNEGEVWVNGEQVPLDFLATGDDWLADSEVGDTVLRAGSNTVAVRSCDEREDWRFYFRLTEPDGGTVDGVRWEYDGG